MSRNYRKNYRKKASLKHRIIELVILLVIMIAVSAAGAIYDRYQNENKVMPDGQMTVHFIDVGHPSILIPISSAIAVETLLIIIRSPDRLFLINVYILLREPVSTSRISPLPPGISSR